MATNFPTSLDTLSNPTGSSSLTSPDHAGQHADANDAIEALQTKVGVDGSAVTTSLDYKVTAAAPAGTISMYAGLVSPPDGWLLCDGATASRSVYSALFNAVQISKALTFSSGSSAITGTGFSASMVGWGIAGQGIPSGAYILTYNSSTSVTLSTTTTSSSSGSYAISPYGFTGANNTTTFNLPNLKGRIPVGRDSAQTEFDVLGETGGAKTHTLSSTEMPSHTHTQNSHTHTQDSHNHSQNAHLHGGYPGAGTGEYLMRDNAYNTGYNSWVGGVYLAITWVGATGGVTATNIATTATNQSTIATNQNTGGGGAHNNLQPYIVLNYIIKT